jgi:hypothetical protein
MQKAVNQLKRRISILTLVKKQTDKVILRIAIWFFYD